MALPSARRVVNVSSHTSGTGRGKPRRSRRGGCHLRFCGYDATYTLDRGIEADDALLAVAREEGRTLLTRDVALANRAGDRGLLLCERETAGQLRELADAGCDLTIADRPARCGACNGPVERLSADASVPEYARDPSEIPVWRCRVCEQHFWKGSHWTRVEETLAGI